MSVKDMKAGVRGRKPPLYQLPYDAMVYGSRAFQYGANKYAPGNYLREPAEGEDVERLLDYIASVQRHLGAWAMRIMRTVGEGRGRAPIPAEDYYAADEESGLPHACHAVAGLLMGIQQAIDAGLLPADPGVTWVEKASE